MCQSRDQSKKGGHQILQWKVLTQKESRAGMGHQTKGRRSEIQDKAWEADCKRNLDIDDVLGA
jgi:hypothetical protein